MTPAERHTAVLAGLANSEASARAAQPGGAWYQEGRDVATDMPLLTPAEMAELHPDEFEDWVFSAATKADAAHIVANNPAATLLVLAGRRRILQRHAPEHVPALGILWCMHCREDNDGDGSALRAQWPCSDYRDAAAGLLDQGAADD